MDRWAPNWQKRNRQAIESTPGACQLRFCCDCILTPISADDCLRKTELGGSSCPIIKLHLPGEGRLCRNSGGRCTR